MRYPWLINLSPVLLPALGLFFSLRGIITRRAFVYSARWMLGIFLIAFVPPLFIGRDLFYDARRHSLDPSGIFQVVLLVVLLVVMWRQFGGYFTAGATDESLRSGLYAALRKLNLPFQESLSRIRLTSIGVDLSVSPARLGTGHLTLRQPGHRAILKQITEELNGYFAARPGDVNMDGFYLYGLFSILLLASSLFLFHRS